MKITPSQARKIVLNCQLLSGSAKIKSSEDIIRHLGYVQIDTISVIERSHHHVLYTRNGKYLKKELDEMVSNNSIFEYWAHAAAYLPISDYRYSLYQKMEFRKGKQHWYSVDSKIKKRVYETIKNEGSKMSRDFDHQKTRKNDWYDPKPIRMVLNQLFIEGQLVVSARRGFQKVYDLPERCLPTSIIDEAVPTRDEFAKYLIEGAIKSNGLVKSTEIIYLRKGMRDSVNRVLNEMMENEDIVKIEIEGLGNCYFGKRNIIDRTNEIEVSGEVHFLSPFDNLIIQRKRLKDIFDFDYQLECYYPKHKRAYGYFVMPILFDGKIVARMDSKADRKLKQFKVIKLCFENGFVPNDFFVAAFKVKLQALAEFNKCLEITIGQVTPVAYKKMIA